MLIARGEKTIGRARMRWAYVILENAWLHILDNEGLVFDSRLMPGAPGPAKQRTCVELFVRGTWETFRGLDGAFTPVDRGDDKTAVAVTLEQLEGAECRRPFAFRVSGDRFVIVEVHVKEARTAHFPELPVRVDLDEAAWRGAARAGTLSDGDDRALADGITALMSGLVERGILAADPSAMAIPRPVELLWGALRPMIENMSLANSLDLMSAGAGLPIPRLRRELERLAGYYVGPGVRELTHHLRMKVAVTLLSAQGVSVADVAREVGYGSLDAMGRAFRDAGLSTPSYIRRQLVGARSPSEEGTTE